MMKEYFGLVNSDDVMVAFSLCFSSIMNAQQGLPGSDIIRKYAKSSRGFKSIVRNEPSYRVSENCSELKAS
jgi:hypothetical protein